MTQEILFPITTNLIHQGDCVELLKRIEAASVDLVFADPPFNIGYEYDVYDDKQQTEDYLDWSGQWISGVHRALKPDGTFWLAIGDEYAAELKIEAQKIGFHCRSWVIWYYTFGVNCVNGFSRSHTHLFHFVKNPKRFTFNRFNPQIRVRSARQLVYADNRANPNGRLPDNTWITRPQDAPTSFSPMHDTWYFARVAGTFKEREGFHGCQMPEQLLGRIIRSSSHPQELVLDPFGGSGTTLCVAKKLGRQWMGFELSQEYAKYIGERLQRTAVGDPLDGAEDPLESAPSTRAGKRRKNVLDPRTDTAISEAYWDAGKGVVVEELICDSELNSAFVKACTECGLKGTPVYWNRYLLELQRRRKLPKPTRSQKPLTVKQLEKFGYASEVAWRLLSLDYQKTLDEILCSPEFAAEFDRLAVLYGPADVKIVSREFRLAALAIREQSLSARRSVESLAEERLVAIGRMTQLSIEQGIKQLKFPGLFLLLAHKDPVYVGQSKNIGKSLEPIFENEHWRRLNLDNVKYLRQDGAQSLKLALKSAIAQQNKPILNCRLLLDERETTSSFNP